MVLEERIPVQHETAAKDIIQYLKRSGISARIVNESQMSIALILSGRYEDLLLYLEDMRDRIISENRHGDEEDDGDDTFLDSNNHDVWEAALKYLNEEHCAIADVMEKYKPGDIIGKHVYQFIFLKGGAQSSCTPEELTQELGMVRTLISNKVLDITEQGFVLTRIIHPNDITVYIPYEYHIPPDQDTCDQYHIVCIRHIRGDIRYVVQTGPEIIFLDDVEAFLSYLSGMEVELPALMTLAERFMSKLRITQEIISQLFEGGEVSLDDLRLLFIEEIASQEGEGYLQDRFGLSPEFIDSLVADMRKINLIKGKDSKLKPVRLSENSTGKKR